MLLLQFVEEPSAVIQLSALLAQVQQQLLKECAVLALKCDVTSRHTQHIYFTLEIIIINSIVELKNSLLLH